MKKIILTFILVMVAFLLQAQTWTANDMNGVSYDLTNFKLYCLSLKSFATAKAVKAFTNSEGCKLMDPKLNHDFAPFISFPRGNNNTSAIRDIT